MGNYFPSTILGVEWCNFASKNWSAIKKYVARFPSNVEKFYFLEFQAKVLESLLKLSQKFISQHFCGLSMKFLTSGTLLGSKLVAWPLKNAEKSHFPDSKWILAKSLNFRRLCISISPFLFQKFSASSHMFMDSLSLALYVFWRRSPCCCFCFVSFKKCVQKNHSTDRFAAKQSPRETRERRHTNKRKANFLDFSFSLFFLYFHVFLCAK